MNAQPITSLTSREHELLEFLGEGFTRSEVCNKMFISLHTYDQHRKNIRRKLNIKSQADWARIMYQILL